MKSFKILLYAVNGLGLGHITRLLAIAKYLRRYLLVLGKQPDILFLTTSEVDSLPYLFDFPAVKIPSKTIIEKGGMVRADYRKMAKLMIWNCISAYNPEILVVDTFPTGSFDELYDVMDFGFKKAFVYRPRKDKKKLWTNPILKAYDRIIYIDESYEKKSNSAEDALYQEITYPFLNIVQRDKTEFLDAGDARQYLGLNPDKMTACILAGGGGDKSNVEFFNRIIPIISGFCDIQFIIAAGPLYRGPEIHIENAKWYYRADLSMCWNAFDFAVSAGGFNSVNELIYAQVPTLFFSQDRLYDDQEARIKSFSKKGICLYFSMENSDRKIVNRIKKIADPEVRRTLKEKMILHEIPNHTSDAALAILGLYFSESVLESAEELIDMGFIKKFTDKGLDERTVCKCIYAVSHYQNKYNTQSGVEFDLIDNFELLEFTEAYLNYVLENDIPNIKIINQLFDYIKTLELSNAEEFIANLKNIKNEI